MHNLCHSQKNLKSIALFIFTSIAIIVNIFRLQYNLFWGDECYSIISSYSFDNFIDYGVGDGASPPLLYFSFFLFTKIFGSNPLVYQLFPLLAAFCILFLGATIIRKEFGFSVSLIFIILASLLPTSINFFTDVRYYEWYALLVLISYLTIYKIFHTHENGYYILLATLTIAGIYLNYYYLMTAGLIYIVCLIDAFINDKKQIKTIFISIAVISLSYLPEIIHSFTQVVDTGSDFWISTVPTIIRCMDYMFDIDYGIIFFAFMIVTSLFIIIGAIVKDKKLSPSNMWIASGLFIVLGSIFISVIFSELVKPLLMLRYLYPVSVIAWLVLAYSVINCWKDKEKLKNATTVIIVSILLIATVPAFIDTLEDERWRDSETKRTVELLKDIGTGDDEMVLTDVSHFDWTMLDYYLPDTNHSEYHIEDIPKLDPTIRYYLYIENKMDSHALKILNDNGYGYETIVEGCFLDDTNYTFNVYRLTR